MAIQIGSSTPTSGGADNAGCTSTTGQPTGYPATANATGTIDTLFFFETTIADSAITGVEIGMFNDSAGTPTTYIGSGTFSGRPAANTWISVSGLSIPVVNGTTYWLVILPKTSFAGGQNIFFNDGNSTAQIRWTNTTVYTSLAAADSVAWNAGSSAGPLSIYGTGSATGTDLNVVLIN